MSPEVRAVTSGVHRSKPGHGEETVNSPRRHPPLEGEGGRQSTLGTGPGPQQA